MAFGVLCPAVSVEDSPSYLEPARSWAAGHGLREGERPLESRLPLYPLALGLVIRLFGDSPRALSLFNAACHAGGVLLARRILRERVDGATADIVAAGALVYPPLLTSTACVLQESFLSLLLAAVFYALWRALNSGGTAWSAGAGALLGLSGLAKVTSLPIAIPAAALLMLGRGHEHPQMYKVRRLGRAAALLVAATLALLPWAIRNDVVIGRFEVTNSNGGLAFLGGTVSNTISEWYAFPEYVDAQRQWLDGERVTHPVLDHYLYVVAARRIAARPWRWLGLVAERVGRFMLPARHWLVVVGLARNATFPPWYVLLTVVNVALFLAAAWLALRAWRERDPALAAAPLIVFGHQAVYAVTYASPRYGVTIGPVLIAAAVLAVAPRDDSAR